ncbi:MAG: hypothetical protein ACRDGA_13240 [Bacteroidota bacterium]
MLTQENQPEIILQEEHSPTSGKFEPAIAWQPSQTINTADYFEQIEDSVVIEVTATATNIAQMETFDTRKITLKKNLLDSLIVTAEPDTIEPAQASVIAVIAKDNNKNDLTLPGETAVQFSLDAEGASLGKLESPSSHGSSLTATWDEVQSGSVKYVALEEVQTPPPVLAKVSAAGSSTNAVTTSNEIRGRAVVTASVTFQGQTKSNSATVVVKEPIKLTITLSETTVRPKGTGEDNKSKTTVTVTATRGGSPVKDVPIELKVEPVPFSGGHDHHDADRPKGTIKSAQNTTNTEGKLVAEYTAPKVGGKEKISASSTQATKKDSAEVTVAVPDLQNFGGIGHNFWDLTGNSGPTTYKNCVGTLIQHSSNHFGTRSMIDSLQLALLDFFAWSGTPVEEGGVGTYLVLNINDMSLVFGGLFDICSTWQRGHTYHRTGASVDINSKTKVFGNTNTVDLSSPLPDGTTILDVLTDKMSRHGGQTYPEEPIHYGFGGK